MNNREQNESPRELIERLEREFGQRAEPPVNEPRAIPLADTGEPGRVQLRLPTSRPRVVYALLAINVLMYALTLALWYARQNSGVGSDAAFSLVLYQLGAKYGPAISDGQYWRFLTPIVLHGGLIHLGFNSYALYALGPAAERVYGSARFLAVYLLAGFAGSIASYVRSPGLSIGASGAIFGLIGALAASSYTARGLIGQEASRQQITQLISMAAINIVLGLSVAAVDNAAHVGGLVAGAVAGFAFAPRYRIDDRLYPPVVVRADNPATSWLMGALVLLALVALAVVAVMRIA